MLAVNESIREIIRVLQLTSPTEEAGAFASSTGADVTGLPGGLLPGTLAAKIFIAKDLIGQTGGLVVKFCSPIFLAFSLILSFCWCHNNMLCMYNVLQFVYIMINCHTRRRAEERGR